ncbi:MAG TPA: MarR family transcriptional regulator [Chroococcidiopsis sp.]
METTLILDNLRSSVWRLFLTANVRLLDRIETKMAEAGLPPLEWYDILLTLKEAPKQYMRLSDLADKVLLSRSNLTRLLDRLEKAQLLKRQPCPSDRRGLYAVLTDEGLAMQQRMWVVYSEGIAEYFACELTDEEAIVFQRVLQKLLQRVEAP